MKKMNHNIQAHLLSVLVFSLLLTIGCATQLAPPYDKAVVDSLNVVNTDAMTLFASVAGGTKKADYNARSARYIALIGKLDALVILAGARPLPQNNLTEIVNHTLEKRQTTPLVDDNSEIPSTHAIKKISETIEKMRATDEKQGVTATEASGFKNQAAIYFDQAVTYENFLQR
jgi:hypothetical protein